MALERIGSRRWRAAVTSAAVLPGRIGDRLCRLAVVFESGDDLLKVGDLLVHLDQAGLAAGLGGGDDLEELLAVLVGLGVDMPTNGALDSGLPPRYAPR